MEEGVPETPVKPHPPIDLDAGLEMLEKQVDVLIGACGAAAVVFHSSKRGRDEVAQVLAVSAPLWLAHEMLEGLVLCAKKRLAAPVHALTRSVWESLLNSNVHLFRQPEASLDAIKFEAERVSRANEAGAWPKSPDEDLRTVDKLKFLRAAPGAGEVAHKLDRSRYYLYKDASARIHGSFYGSLSNATLAGTSMDGQWSRDHEVEPMAMWLMIAVDATIAAFCARFLFGSNFSKQSRALVEAFVALIENAGGNPASVEQAA